MVATVYYTGDLNNKKEEALILVDSDGKLSLSETEVMTDYKVAVGRTEFVTKCAYDSV